MALINDGQSLILNIISRTAPASIKVGLWVFGSDETIHSSRHGAVSLSYRAQGLNARQHGGLNHLLLPKERSPCRRRGEEWSESFPKPIGRLSFLIGSFGASPSWTVPRRIQRPGGALAPSFPRYPPIELCGSQEKSHRWFVARFKFIWNNIRVDRLMEIQDDLSKSSVTKRGNANVQGWLERG